ncbi:MAG: hypothetical protein MAGBODY4_00410 [Candidatus Marinimicrobia bacterium]|nr:hypothetical protein [Candidatus Neomarinimicrobiota bacterium]
MSAKSLVQFEHNFERHIEALEKTPWGTLQITILEQLIREITANFSGIEQFSYFTEIAPYLIHVFMTSEFQLGYTDPAIISRFLNHIRKEQFLWQVPGPEDRKTIIRTGIRSIARGYFRLQEFDKLSRFLTEQQVVDSEISKSAPGVNREKYWGALRDHLPEFLFNALWREQAPPDYYSDTIMGLFAIRWQEYRVGAIGKISLEDLSLTNEKAQDQIRIATHLVNDNDIIGVQARDVCNYLRSRMAIPGKHRLTLRYSIDQPVSLLTGNSVGLALSLLGEIGLRNFRGNLSWETQVNERVMFTGAVDSAGNVSEIEDQDIPEKIESAFFGPADSVVLPEEHAPTARNTVAELRQRYPNREIEILPVDRISRLHDNPVVIRSTKRSIGERARRFFNAHIVLISFLIVLAFSVGSIVLYEEVIKESPPARVETLKNSLAVKNNFGLILWESEPFGARENAGRARELARIVDLDGDGVKEVLLCYDESTIQGFRSSIVCYTKHGEILWQRNIYFPVRYQQKTITSLTRVDDLRLTDFNGDGTAEIVSIIRTPADFPTRVMVLNSKGKPVTDYWHSGRLNTTIVSGDVYPNNDTNELVLWGSNAEYKTGVVLALDPFRTRGTSHQNQQYFIPRDIQPGNEIFYLRFPETPFLSKFTSDLTALASPWDGKSFLVRLVNEISRKYFDDALAGGIYYKIGQHFRIDSVSISRRFYDLREQALPAYPEIQNTIDLIDEYRRVQYFDGESWVTDPTINRIYLNSLTSSE